MVSLDVDSWLADRYSYRRRRRHCRCCCDLCCGLVAIAGFLHSAFVNVTLARMERVIKTGIFSFPVSVKLLNPFDCPIHISSLDLFVRGRFERTQAWRTSSSSRSHCVAYRKHVVRTCANPINSDIVNCNFASVCIYSCVRSFLLQVQYQNVSVGYCNTNLSVTIPPGEMSFTPYVNVTATKGA